MRSLFISYNVVTHNSSVARGNKNDINLFFLFHVNGWYLAQSTMARWYLHQYYGNQYNTTNIVILHIRVNEVYQQIEMSLPIF